MKYTSDKMCKIKKVEIRDFWNDSEDDGSYSGELRIKDDNIFVSYMHDGDEIMWDGKEQGKGHFILKSRDDVKSRATLHRLEGSNILEGSYSVGDDRGMWKFEIQEEE